jgi:AcrR family transcriptional regulator
MKPQPLRHVLREATSNAILEAAEHVAARDGLSSASLQAIAEQAGVAVGTIYNYYEDKPALFDALFLRRRAELFTAIDEATKQFAREPFQKQLHTFVHAVFAYFDVRRDFLRIAQEADRNQHVAKKGEDAKKTEPAMQQLQIRAERVIRVGVRDKELRLDCSDLLAKILVGIVRGVLQAGADGEHPFAAETPRVVDIFLHGAAK